MSNPIKTYQNSLKSRLKESKASFIVFTVLRILILAIIVRSIIIGNYEATATCILTLLLLLLPCFLEGALKVNIPPLFEIIIYCFIFSANILGELAHFYAHIPIWDTLLHTLNGFLFAAVGFSAVDLLNRNSKNVKLSPLYLTLVAFCVSMTVGVLWEFFECGMDLLFGTDMQKDFIVNTIHSCELDPAHNQTVIEVKDIVSTQIHTASGEIINIDGGYLDIGILDSMKDLFVNFIGAIVFCIFGFIYLKVGSSSKTAKVVEGLKIQPAAVDEEEEARKKQAKLEKKAAKEEKKAAKEEKKAKKKEDK